MTDLPALPTAGPKGGQRGLKQAYIMREIAAANAILLKDEPVQGLKERSELARALKDFFSVWDGCRQAIRVYKGQGNPKPVEAKNGSRRKRNGTVGTAPPPPLGDAPST